MRLILLAALLAGIAAAQDAQLTAVHATLVELRSQAPDPETMGASEKLTVAKHQLRDWIDIKPFAFRINGALKTVSAGGSDDDQNLAGSLAEVRFNEEGGLLIVVTGVGIICQDDESAYAYKKIEKRWRRVWESEQNDYRKGQYNPQLIDAVHIWQKFDAGHADGPPFVMTLGNLWGCGSFWHSVTYRVWRIDTASPKLLIDRTEGAYMRTAAFIIGSIGQEYDEKSVDVLIEFTEGNIDVGVHNREAIRHFLIDGDRVARVDPVALSPRDFVDEWLTRPWEESKRWSASPDLKQWFARLQSDRGGSRFDETLHCATPDLWEVTLTHYGEQKGPAGFPDHFFLVRWRPPYHFTMVDVSTTPWPRCTEKDPDADAWRTLFATQDWR
jgi:hypothetical protein